MSGRRERSSWLIEAVAWCLPAGCLACRDPLPPVAPLSLCRRCHAVLRSQRRACCATCSRDLTGDWHLAGMGAHRCEACRKAPPAFDRLASLWDYDERARPVIHGLKFGGLRYLGRHVAEAMLERFAEEIERTDVMTAVPLHPWRYLHRGYNQATEIAAPLARLTGKPHERLLQRTRATRPQRGLDGAARRANLAGAFRLRRGPQSHGRSVLLIDDVVTTGATLHAAAEALRAAGAARIVALTAARTPSPEPSTHTN